jgi:hypothetical protein
MKRIIFIFGVGLFLLSANTAFCQSKDSLAPALKAATKQAAKRLSLADTIPEKPKHNPKKATMHSLILPGWGQVYNKAYWKVPIVYAALGITGAVYIYNRKEYNRAKFAYFTLINKDTANYKNVAPEFSYAIQTNDSYALQQYRNDVRKNVDYSVLFFILFWGLNVVDATVDGHLKDFDVSNNLSMRVKPYFTPLPNTVGLSLVFNIGKNNHPHKALDLR